MIRKRAALTSLALLHFSVGLASLASACQVTVTWQAALTGRPVSPSVSPPATGTAIIDFDFPHPGATIQVDTKGLQDVRAIELHVARSYSDHTGPAVLTLYTSADGPLPARLTKHVTEADLHTQTDPKIAAFGDVVSAVLNGRAYVVVTTQAHPEGELSGVIRMHKAEVYSDNAADPAHDPALHHAAPRPR